MEAKPNVQQQIDTIIVKVWDMSQAAMDEPIGRQETLKWAEKELFDLAEASFSAGAREVVEFVTERIFPMLEMGRVSVSFKDTWNAKLTSLGI